jgi:hypothetical protein
MRQFGPQKGGNEVSQVGEEILLTKEDPECRVIELSLFSAVSTFLLLRAMGSSVY